MTKRACPFDYRIGRQLKIHLSDFENDENLAKIIKEQTMAKLMEGSKRFYSNGFNLKNSKSDRSEFDVVPPNRENEKKSVQKCMTNYFTVNGKLLELFSENVSRTSTVDSSTSKCSFCESDANFLHRCIKCTEFYCNSCSFINYESLDDTRTCISCS